MEECGPSASHVPSACVLSSTWSHDCTGLCRHMPIERKSDMQLVMNQALELSQFLDTHEFSDVLSSAHSRPSSSM